MRKVLVVEDEKEISELLEIHLTDLNCEVTKANDGKVGLDIALNEQFDLIVLDIMLPSLDGMEICKEVRKREIYVPILMLTAKSEEFDKVLGLEIGADDYLTKPFSIREFIARVKAIFRRIDAVQKTDVDNVIINVGDLKIDVQKRRVILNGDRIELTQKEFDLLQLMATHPGRTYTREQLLNTVWGYQYNGYEHTVNSHINRLRTKIEDDLSNPKFIRTSWGVGYWFNDSFED
jgi:two-component system, OmpR family, alkaline phosphatase synthesis response regulator PhoP